MRRPSFDSRHGKSWLVREDFGNSVGQPGLDHGRDCIAQARILRGALGRIRHPALINAPVEAVNARAGEHFADVYRGTAANDLFRLQCERLAVVKAGIEDGEQELRAENADTAIEDADALESLIGIA
jgi:hypothetical protein